MSEERSQLRDVTQLFNDRRSACVLGMNVDDIPVRKSYILIVLDSLEKKSAHANTPWNILNSILDTPLVLLLFIPSENIENKRMTKMDNVLKFWTTSHMGAFTLSLIVS